MSGTFQKRSAGILAAVMIGLIILSFMFTGYYSEMGMPTSDVVATVDREPIKVGEFQRAMAQRVDFFRQLMGGQELTAKQIEQFGLKESVLQWLIEQKLFTNFASQLGIRPSAEEIALAIKEQPVFKGRDGERFDVQLYKMILAQNGLSPSDYEKSVADGLAGMELQNLMNEVPLSQGYLNELLRLKEKALKVSAIQLNKENLKKIIPVTESEISAFTNDPKNQSKLEAHFLSRKKELDQAEMVKARHILLRANGESDEGSETDKKALLEKAEKLRKSLTPQNFAQMAEKETQDPSGKGKGGDLGWFGRGAMVPEFEKVAFALPKGSISEPVESPFGVHLIWVEDKKDAKEATLAAHRSQMGKEIIQGQKGQNLKAYEQEAINELRTLLDRNSKEDIEKAQKKYDFSIVKERNLDPVESNLGNISLEPKQLESLFQEKMEGSKLFVFNNATSIVVLKASPKMDADNSVKSEDGKPAMALEEERTKQQVQLGQQLKKALTEHLQEKAKIKTYSNI